LLDIEEIFYVLKEKRKVVVYTKDRCYWEYGSMDDIIDQGDERLFRCHYSLAVNLAHIREIGACDVCLANGTQIAMCRAALTDTKKAWVDYVR
jgi:DNA-binding LytR/AlgR family response regulator